jgi:hypothetical protein
MKFWWELRFVTCLWRANGKPLALKKERTIVERQSNQWKGSFIGILSKAVKLEQQRKYPTASRNAQQQQSNAVSSRLSRGINGFKERCRRSRAD